MSGRKVKEQRKQEAVKAEHAKAQQSIQDAYDKVMLSAIKSAVARRKYAADDAMLVIDVRDNPGIASREYILGFSLRYEDLLKDMCEKLGYGGVFVADPRLPVHKPGEKPTGVFQVYRAAKRLIVLGDN